MFKRIFEHLNTAILLFDDGLELTYINPAGEMLLLGSARHLLGLSAYDLFRQADYTILSNLQQCLGAAEAFVEREIALDRATRSVTVDLIATPLLENDRVTDVLVELQQVDNHLRISKEEQLLAQQQTARLLVRGLAHEIKNPLGGLRGAAQLLEMELNDPELKEYTRIIIAESDRMQTLMDKMLGPNKLPTKTHINIHEVLERVRQLISAELPGQVKIKCDYDPSIPNLMADKDQLIQATLNIARNAVQAMNAKGGLTFRTRIFRNMTIERKNYKLAIKCEIIDTGPGIDHNIINQIFYPMVTGRADGTGLGLSIAQSLINQHGGIIECASEPGNTVFSILLPLGNGHG